VPITLDPCGTTLPAFVDHTTETQWQVLSGLEFITLSGARNIAPTPTAVVRTRLQKELGGYPPELPHAGDFEMWLWLLPTVRSESHTLTMPFTGATRATCPGTISIVVVCSTFNSKEAFDCFMDACREILPDAEDTYRRFSR
jgi:hypothetical protein